MFGKMRYIYAVYQEGSFTKAAEKLFISQPSLSAAVRRLEEELGVELFERGGRVRPTEIGLSYIYTAERIMALEEEFAAGLRGYQQLEHGEVAVGGSNLVSSYILPGIIGAFSRRYPQITVTMSEANSDRLLGQLETEEVDLIIDSFDEKLPGYEFCELRTEQILLAVPREIAQRRKLTERGICPQRLYEQPAELDSLQPVPINAFRDEPFILLKSGNSMYRHAMDCFQKGEMVPKVSFFLDQLITSYALCAEGSGVCFVSDTMFLAHCFRDDVLLFRADAGTRSLCVAYQKNRSLTPAMRCFMETAKLPERGRL